MHGAAAQHAAQSVGVAAAVTCMTYPAWPLAPSWKAHSLTNVKDLKQLHPAQIGKGVLRREGADVALVGYGTMVHTCLAAAEQLAKSGIEVRAEVQL